MNALPKQEPVRKQGGDPAFFSVYDIHAYYGESYIVQGLSFDIREGEILALLGRNGAGKTSTLRTLARMGDPELKHGEIWLDHQRGKISRALAVMEQALPDPRKTDVVSISLACALGYLDWRKPFEWRSTHPAVVQWLDDFSAAEAAFAKTERPAEMPA